MAVTSRLLMTNTTDTAAQWYQPVSISATVQFWGVRLFSILHTCAPYFHERG